MICPSVMLAWICGIAGNFRFSLLLIFISILNFSNDIHAMVQRYKYVCDDCLNDDFTGKLPSRKVILRKIEMKIKTGVRGILVRCQINLYQYKKKLTN